MTHMFETIARFPPGAEWRKCEPPALVMKGLVGIGSLVPRYQHAERPAMSAWDTGAGKMPGGTINDPHVYDRHRS